MIKTIRFTAFAVACFVGGYTIGYSLGSAVTAFADGIVVQKAHPGEDLPTPIGSLASPCGDGQNR